MVEINLKLPQWAEKELQNMPTHFRTLEERMAAVVDFSRKNFQNGTGGPFAAGVFEKESGRMVVIGVNRVVPSKCSSAHAEVMALSLAQKMLGTWDLGAPGMPTHQLVVNWRPCAMCYGAVIWSGVRSLVVAGSGPELEEITGFDEGPVPADWQGELEKRGIELVDGVLTDQATRVFQEFADSGALVYNSRQG
ncbi:MAG: nucleoside deaminase [Ardenticatenaceae bacterium]|nr:nucleoside deaminase [Ardenticatenaceae bacterium]